MTLHLDQFIAAGDLHYADTTVTVYACPACGCLTATPTAHADWHDQLGQILTELTQRTDPRLFG